MYQALIERMCRLCGFKYFSRARISGPGHFQSENLGNWRQRPGAETRVYSAPATTTQVSEDTEGNFTMKKLGFTILAAAVLALPLCAQVASTIRADIPFEFAVDGTTAAPGTYVFTLRAGSPVVQLGGSQSLFTQTSPNSSYNIPQAPKLVFHRYGDQYFLSQICTMSESRDFMISRTERELKKTAAAGKMRTEIVLAMR